MGKLEIQSITNETECKQLAMNGRKLISKDSIREKEEDPGDAMKPKPDNVQTME